MRPSGGYWGSRPSCTDEPRSAARARGESALKVLYLVPTGRRPNRSNPDRADQRLEDHPQCTDHPLRRPHPGRQLTMTITPGYTTNRTVPSAEVEDVEDRGCTICAYRKDTGKLVIVGVFYGRRRRTV